jgi:hypothetical protein
MRDALSSFFYLLARFCFFKGFMLSLRCLVSTALLYLFDKNKDPRLNQIAGSSSSIGIIAC